ncbi:hypothetical protein AB3S75_000485 [Citrus x aurantiifolia]
MESGYKFQPSDELILRLLKVKRLNPHFSHHPIKDIDHICSLEPWDLPTESKTESEDQVFYFFYEPRYKYRNSNRVDRRTEAGQWKITSEDSHIEAGNGLTGTKKFLTFYCRGPDSKVPVKTDWLMHEYHVKDDPHYEKEFVLCCIKRKRNKKKKRGISTIDEGGSSQQLVFPPHQSPSDRSISNGIHSEKNTPTIPPQQPPQQPQELLLVGEFNAYGSYKWRNDSSFSAMQTPISQEQELIYSNSSFDNCDFSDCQIDSDEQVNYPIDSLRAFQDVNSRKETGQTPIPDFNPSKSDGEASAYAEDGSETNTSDNDAWVKELLDNDQRLLVGELKSYDGHNGLIDASFSAVQTPISQEQELIYSNSSFDNCHFSDYQIYRDEQVNHLINFPRAFPDENSRKETGQTLTSDFNLSKSDGEASAGADDSSGRNMAYNDAWIKQLLEDFP